MCVSWCGASSRDRCLLKGFGCGQDGLDDVLVSRAAAQIARHAMAHFFGRGVGVVLQKAVGAHQHAGGAKTALQAVLFVERVLNGVQHAATGQALDGFHVAALALHGEVRAGLHRLAINVHGAGTAVAGLAADMRAGKAHFFTQKMNQEGARFHRFFDFFAVQGQGNNFLAHGETLRSIDK